MRLSAPPRTPKLAPLATLCCVVLAASQALAGPVEDLAAVIKDAVASPEPTTALLKGFVRLGDMSLTGAQVQEALRLAGTPANGIVATMLANTSISKKGDRLTINRPGESIVPIVADGQTKAYADLGRKVTFRIRPNGKGVLLDSFDGIKIGKKKDDLYDLKKIFAETRGDNVHVDVTAGWGIFTDTVSMDIPIPPAPKPVAPKPVAPKPVQPGPVETATDPTPVGTSGGSTTPAATTGTATVTAPKPAATATAEPEPETQAKGIIRAMPK